MMLTACSNVGVNRSKESSGTAANSRISQVSQSSVTTQPDYGAGVVEQAALYKSSPSRVALSMLVCRLGSSYIYGDLVKKSAKELFEIVSETAVENSVTLESLNNRYGLCDILASENIYVSIEANSVTSLPQKSRSSLSEKSKSKSSKASTKSEGKAAGASSSSVTPSWAAKFQKAILQASAK
jgi:hypothetical protein